METKCQKLRIILHKPHSNVNNKSNQVGLISLNFFGESVKDSMEVNLKFPQNNLHNVNTGNTVFQTPSKEDDFIAKRIHALNKAKEKALELEDFDEAKNIKAMLESLKNIGKDLVMLESKKLKAIADEDFDTAKLIKVEIERIKNGVLDKKQNPNQNINTNMNKSNANNNNYNKNNIQNQNDENEYNDNNSNTNTNYYNQPNSRPNQSQNQFNNNSNTNNEKYGNNTTTLSSNNKINQKNNSNNVNTNTTNTNNNSNTNKNNNKTQQQQIEKPKPEKIDVDKFVVKGIGDSFSKYVEQKMNNDGQGNQEDEEEEDIPEEEYRKAEPLVPLIGGDLIKNLLSKNWKNKEKAIIFLTEDLSNQPNSELLQNHSPDMAIIAVFGAASIAFDCKSSQLLIGIMDMIIISMEVFSNLYNISNDNENMFLNYCDATVHHMMEKVGDSNSKIREKAETATFEMAKCPVIGRDFILKRLMEAQIKKQLVTSNKHLAARLSLIGRIIESLTVF